MKLAVVTAISNPERYASRYRLYTEFSARMRAAGVDLWTVECAFGQRPWAITHADNPRHVQVRSSHQLWLKENLLNLGAAAVPPDYDCIAFVDADFAFAHPHWPSETVQQLQHHPVVQMFSTVHYLTGHHEVEYSRMSFAERWRRGLEMELGSTTIRREVWPYEPAKRAPAEHGNAQWGPPGGAWAFRRETLEQLGGLIDFCILGSADWWMVQAMVGVLEHGLPHSYSEGYRAQLHAWQERAQGVVAGDIGVVRTAAWHYWHGSMDKRGYGKREAILKRNRFNPLTDLYADNQGVIALQEGDARLRQLRADCRAYFQSRDEDAAA